MPFDNNLTLHDGTTITADITPTSTSRSGGSAVINLKKTPATGLYATMIVSNDLGAASDTMQVTIQHSTSAGGTYEEVGRFPLLTKGTNMPGVFVTRFLSTRMADGSTPTHVRALINVTDASGSDFTVASVYIFITDNAQIVGW